MNNQIVPNRQTADPQWLEDTIHDLLEGWVGQKRTFTAYDVTQELRRQYPNIEILHPEVRGNVHYLMGNAIMSTRWLYDYEVRPYTDPKTGQPVTAMTYFPLVLSQVQVDVPKLPANTTPTIVWDDDDL